METGYSHLRIGEHIRKKIDATHISDSDTPLCNDILQLNFDMQIFWKCHLWNFITWSKNLFKNMLAHLEAGWQQARKTNSEKVTPNGKMSV
jgi:hypothetical protein